MTPAADLIRALPVGGKSLALLGSVSVHAALALAVVHGATHASRNTNVPTDAIVEIAALELAIAEPPLPPLAEPTPASAAARHHHDYPVPPDHDATPHDPRIEHVLPLARALSHTPAAAPAVLESLQPAAPRFVMSVGPAPRALAATSRESPAAAGPSESAPAAEPAPEAQVDTPAKLLAGRSPSYTPEAETAGVEADVPLEIVVDSAGSVLSARALSHIGYGLDEAALRSVRGYRFSPARRAGKALAVRMHWLMRFQLR